jgi:hypothetical protein
MSPAVSRPDPEFHEAALSQTPIRDLGLRIAGTPLEPILAEFERELDRIGLAHVRPRFYLSTEWGVPMDTVAVAIPFYLARPELTELHARRAGHVEGTDRADILRYLRHEMGHVVSYAYKLYDDADWIERFGSITQPYIEEYRPEPFSRRFVRHLPGWYAQKHPEEDWAETFAVWMTPGLDWRREYGGWPEALAKLEYCERAMAAVRGRPPVTADATADEDVAELDYSLEEFYRHLRDADEELPPGLDGALRAIFDDDASPEAAAGRDPNRERIAAAAVIRRLERDLATTVYVWTGHFPERTRALMHRLAERADALSLRCDAADEPRVALALTTFVTALAMNHVHRGSYLP